MSSSLQSSRDKLLARKAKLDARLKLIDAREQERKRKDDTRAKIIYGALAMEHAATNPDSEFAATMHRLLNRYVPRPADRALFGLPKREANDSSDSEDTAKQADKFRAAASA